MQRAGSRGPAEKHTDAHGSGPHKTGDALRLRGNHPPGPASGLKAVRRPDWPETRSAPAPDPAQCLHRLRAPWLHARSDKQCAAVEMIAAAGAGLQAPDADNGPVSTRLQGDPYAWPAPEESAHTAFACDPPRCSCTTGWYPDCLAGGHALS